MYMYIHVSGRSCLQVGECDDKRVRVCGCGGVHDSVGCDGEGGV